MENTKIATFFSFLWYMLYFTKYRDLPLMIWIIVGKNKSFKNLSRQVDTTWYSHMWLRENSPIKPYKSKMPITTSNETCHQNPRAVVNSAQYPLLSELVLEAVVSSHVHWKAASPCWAVSLPAVSLRVVRGHVPNLFYFKLLSSQ